MQSHTRLFSAWDVEQHWCMHHAQGSRHCCCAKVTQKQTTLWCAVQAYAKARLEGTDEIGAVLLSMSSDLLAFDFKETFVNAFDVSCMYFS